MSYSQPAFVEKDVKAIHSLIKNYPFATILTHHDSRLEMSHLPFILQASEGDHGCLYVHMARANKHSQAIEAAEECVIIFRGPDSYISPHWYENDAEDHIPTWNYAVVHVHGRAERVHDEEKLFWQMTEIYSSHENSSKLPVSDDEKKQMFPHISFFRIPIARIESIFKLSQNRSEADARGAIEGLQRSGDTQKLKLSELMVSALQSRAER